MQQQLYEEYGDKVEDDLLMEYDGTVTDHLEKQNATKQCSINCVSSCDEKFNSPVNAHQNDIVKEHCSSKNTEIKLETNEIDLENINTEAVVFKNEVISQNESTDQAISSIPQTTADEADCIPKNIDNDTETYLQNISEAVAKPIISRVIDGIAAEIDTSNPEFVDFEGNVNVEACRIQAKRKMIIEQILQKPSVSETSTDPNELTFSSNILTNMFTTTHEHGISTEDISRKIIVEEKCDNNQINAKEVVVENPIEIYRKFDSKPSDSESEDDYNDYDDIDSFVADASTKPERTIRGFLHDYDAFLDKMQLKLDKSQVAINDLRNKSMRDTNICEEMLSDEAQEHLNIPDLDEIHQDLIGIEDIDHDSKTNSIERMLRCNDPIFDIPADLLNIEVEALQSNAHNELVDMVDRVYRNRKSYMNSNNDSDDGNDSDIDRSGTANINSIKNYYADNCNFVKVYKEMGPSKLLQKLNDDDDGHSKPSVLFNCEDLENMLTEEEICESKLMKETKQLDSIEEDILYDESDTDESFKNVNPMQEQYSGTETNTNENNNFNG